MLKKLLAAFAALALACAPVSAIAGGNLPDPENINTGALVTLTAQGAATVNSSDQTNLNNHGLKCVFNQSAHTGTPSTTFAIQFKDSASGQYVTYVTSAAITADNTPSPLTVYPGVTATANVSVSDVLTRTWRVTTTVAGTTPAVTATIGCALLS